MQTIHLDVRLTCLQNSRLQGWLHEDKDSTQLPGRREIAFFCLTSSLDLPDTEGDRAARWREQEPERLEACQSVLEALTGWDKGVKILGDLQDHNFFAPRRQRSDTFREKREYGDQAQAHLADELGFLSSLYEPLREDNTDKTDQIQETENTEVANKAHVCRVEDTKPSRETDDSSLMFFTLPVGSSISTWTDSMGKLCGTIHTARKS